MAWIEPKTDWTSADYFNAEDYNRIIGNVSYLKAYLDDLFYNLPNISLGEEKTKYSLIFATEINAIEESLENLNLFTYRFDIGEIKEYIPNGKTPTWEEFNRIENAILRIYNTMIVHKNSLSRLAFTLGNQKGIKV